MITSSNGNGFLWLDICEGNPLVTGEFLSQRASNVGFDIFFDVNLNKQLKDAISQVGITRAFYPAALKGSGVLSYPERAGGRAGGGADKPR